MAEKRKVLMESDKGAAGGVAALDENRNVVGAIPENGYGNPGNGCNLNTLVGKNGWYSLNDGDTYVNAPSGYSGWGVLLVLDKVGVLYQLNTNIIYYCSNLARDTVAWVRMYSEGNLVELRDKLKSIW